VCIAPASVAPVGECVVFLALRLVSLRFVLFRLVSFWFRCATLARGAHRGSRKYAMSELTRTRAIGLWCLVSGLWSLVFGLWSLVSGF